MRNWTIKDIENDLKRLGIQATVEFGYDTVNHYRLLVFLITFNSEEDMHLYKLIGTAVADRVVRFQVREN